MRILHAHAACLNAQNAIRRIAELKDIALQTLDGKVLVDRADDTAFGFQHDGVIGIVGNSSA